MDTTRDQRRRLWRASYVVRATTPADPDAAPSDARLRRAGAARYAAGRRARSFCRIASSFSPTGSMRRPMRERSRTRGRRTPYRTTWCSGPRSKPRRGSRAMPRRAGWSSFPMRCNGWSISTLPSVGMAVRIPLAAPHDTAGLDRVIAIGVRSATPAAEAPAALQALLAKHRYGDGCAIVRAGTPTNDTDSVSPSGWRHRPDADHLFAIEDAPPDIAAGTGALGMTRRLRGSRAARAEPEFAHRLPDAAATDIAEALAMNRRCTRHARRIRRRVPPRLGERRMPAPTCIASSRPG